MNLHKGKSHTKLLYVEVQWIPFLVHIKFTRLQLLFSSKGQTVK